MGEIVRRRNFVV